MYDPPIGMIVDPVQQETVTAVQFAAAVFVSFWVMRGQTAREAGTRLLVLIGGGACVFMEPFADRLGLIWHAAIGQWTLLHHYGHFVPVWMLATYYWYCGGQTLFVVQRIRNGASARDLWRLYWIFAAMDGVLELPVLWFTHVYTYFGNQPFWWPPYFPLPGWYLILNALLPLAAARAVIFMLSLGSPVYRLLIPIVMPMSAFAIFSATAWPIFAALNSDTGKLVSYLAGSTSILLGLLAAHLLTIEARTSVKA